MTAETLVVTATRTDKTLDEVPVPTVVISRDDLEHSGAVTVQDALDDLSNIQFAPDSHGANITMNGLGPKYVLILVDGEQLAGEVRDNIDFSRLNIDAVERIEVVSGAASSLYGSSAIGGVINIITRDVRRPLEYRATGRFSSHATVNWSGALGLRQGPLDSRTELVYKSSEGYDLTPETVAMTVEEYEDVTVGQKLGLQLGDHLALKARGQFYRRDRYDASRLTTNVHPRYQGLSYGASASYELAGTDRLLLSWAADNYETIDRLGAPINEDEQTYENNRNTARLSGDFAVHEKHQLTMGTEYDHENLFTPRVEGEDRQAAAWNGFIQDIILWDDTWSLVLSSRLDSHSEYGEHLSPKATLMMRDRWFTVRASYGAGFRAPSLKELYMDWDHGGSGPFIRGNPDLAPETARHASLSLEFDRRPWNISITAFRYDLDDMIDVIQSLDSPNVYQYRNVDEAVIQGVDILSEVRFLEHLSLSTGYSFVDAEDGTTGEELDGRPRHSATLRLGYRHSGLGLDVNLRGKWSDRKRLGNDGTQDIWQGAYSLWDLTIDKTVGRLFSVQLGVDNLFDDVDRNYRITEGRHLYAAFRLHH